MGSCGASRREDILSLKSKDIVERDGQCLLITFVNTKTNRKRLLPIR